jgi:hypothetical protein
MDKFCQREWQEQILKQNAFFIFLAFSLALYSNFIGKIKYFSTSEGKKYFWTNLLPRLTAKNLSIWTNLLSSDVAKDLSIWTKILPSDVAYFIIFPYETTTKKNNRRLIELSRKSQNK